jgi:hypothetical protein
MQFVPFAIVATVVAGTLSWVYQQKLRLVKMKRSAQTMTA